MTIAELKDGMFQAELPMENLPKGDLTIYVLCNRCIIYPNKNKTNEADLKPGDSESLPISYFIELPNYVDSGTLCFELSGIEQFEVLTLQAQIKGCVRRQVIKSSGQ